jgi:two-component system, chemotaxis family, chemotaxis protein CheY
MKCLIVDDDILSRMALASMLQEVAECDEAAEGREALARISAGQAAGEPYDLVILDIGLPQMSGHDIAKRIREIEGKQQNCRKVPIITVSGRSSVADAIESFCNGQSAAFLPKPVCREGLFAVLAKIGLISSTAAEAVTAVNPAESRSKAHLLRV